MNAHRIAPLLLIALVACGGGGSSGSAPVLPTAAPSSTPDSGMQKIAISLVVPINTGTNGAKRPAYISASALGAGIVERVHG